MNRRLLFGVSIWGILALLGATTKARAAWNDKYYGTIEFKDGRTMEYNYLSSGVAFEGFWYARTLEEEPTKKSIHLVGVKEMIFSDLSEAEKKEIKEKYYGSWRYYSQKATIVFRDGTKWGGIFFLGTAWRWRNDKGEGTLKDAKRITINRLP